MARLLPTSLRQLRRPPLAIRAHSSQPDRFNYIADEFSQEEPTTLTQVIAQFSDGPAIKLYDAAELARFNHPPRPSICLARDFIHDSLYNPNYGYFFNQVEIFDRAADPLQTPSSPAGQAKLADWAESFEDELYAEYFDPTSGLQHNQLRIWHTPTELFKPWYAWSMASYIVQKHLEESKRNRQPPKELKIYEIGAGNGTLCVGILDYIKEHHGQLYEQTRYTTIELSTRLAERQRAKIRLSGHEGRARVVNRSILGLAGCAELKQGPEEPCWVLGMEVLDNLSRDVVRRDRVSGQALQSIVITDHDGDYHERFIPITPQNNPSLLAYLKLFNLHPLNHLHHSRPKVLLERLLAKYLPFRSNLTNHQFIPTNYLILLQNIFALFPNHRLILSDFSHLPNTLNDPRANRLGAPVVQTRYNGVTVPASTFLVQPGMFDIFFPTDFGELVTLYTRLRQQHQPREQAARGGRGRAAEEAPGRPDVQVAVHAQNSLLVDLLSRPAMHDKILKKSAGVGLDLDRIFAYYQNVKVLTVT
ncbi:hypothetical protein PtA15_14A271 [Puccinia triticina]|uniref:Protein arginine methyltransferase NDUFAF7 n=1 Tax=Puccinia triticina TaxID=208348 RepID=A0ABY7D1D7_9BASI|nr:uncharacterized protein PtA15_14A271 [Puccinia triticina]WAQ91388.1 hypothetical protein PtA15_14A271 [Puccinia triticina]